MIIIVQLNDFSDIVAQILDARNPLMFRCEDLEHYVKEVDSNKYNLLILNKADFLTNSQRRAWAKHFDSCHIRVIFFSATQAADNTIPEELEREIEEEQVTMQYSLHITCQLQIYIRSVILSIIISLSDHISY